MWDLGTTGCPSAWSVHRDVNSSSTIVAWLTLSKRALPGPRCRLSQGDLPQALAVACCALLPPQALVVGKPEFRQNTAMIMMMKSLDSFSWQGR